MAISVRTRFEVLKRDAFTCRYCGKSSPEVVLEVDHVVPVCDGGSDDQMNLVAACWGCNRGKAGIPLTEVMTAVDPHERAILLLERERQLREYNEVLRVVNDRVISDLDYLTDLWPHLLTPSDAGFLRNALERYPCEAIRRAMDVAIRAERTDGLGYVNACLKNWTDRGEI